MNSLTDHDAFSNLDGLVFFNVFKYDEIIMGPTITAEKAKKNLDEVLDKATQGSGIWIKKGRLLFHVHQEISKNNLLRSLRSSVEEYKAGKSKALKSLADLD